MKIKFKLKDESNRVRMIEAIMKYLSFYGFTSCLRCFSIDGHECNCRMAHIGIHCEYENVENSELVLSDTPEEQYDKKKH